MKRLLRLLALCALSISLASAQTVIVKRNVVLRSTPSSSGKKLATLTPPTELKLVSFAVRNGYRHVVTDGGTQGWVWSNNVEVQDQGDANEGTGGDTGLLSKLVLYDFEHTGAIGTQRASVWEVHPITKIEVKQNNTWVDLDQ